MSREKPSGWTIAWLAWLLAFVVIEIPAALWSKGGTLSAHIWRRWFDELWERILLASWGVILFVAHFVFEAPAWWSVILGAVGVAAVIIAAEIRHGMQSSALRAEWIGHRKQHEKALRNEYPMWSPTRILHEARRATEALHGPEPKEEGMSPLVRKLIVSVIYGVGALGAVVSAALADGVVNSSEWWAIALAFGTAFWGKFSSNTTLIAPSRRGETIAGPRP